MKLVRFHDREGTSVGIVEGRIVRRLGQSFQAVARVIEDPAGAKATAAASTHVVPVDEVTLLAPVDESARIFAVAQNFPAHALEVSGTEAPPAPVIFMKPTSALIGAGEAIELPPITDFLDYEAEVAVIVGPPGGRLDEAQAQTTIFGIACFNDVTARDLQRTELGGKELIDWFSAKSLDHSSPMGPWVISLDELDGDLGDLGITCRLNGELVQEDRTSSMVSSVARLLAFISERVALRPGDVVATGTPGGVGRARGIKLKEGDIVEVSVEGVGTLRNAVTIRT